jgi:hypothetical protein
VNPSPMTGGGTFNVSSGATCRITGSSVCNINVDFNTNGGLLILGTQTQFMKSFAVGSTAQINLQNVQTTFSGVVSLDVSANTFVGSGTIVGDTNSQIIWKTGKSSLANIVVQLFGSMILLPSSIIEFSSLSVYSASPFAIDGNLMVTGRFLWSFGVIQNSVLTVKAGSQMILIGSTAKNLVNSWIQGNGMDISVSANAIINLIASNFTISSLTVMKHFGTITGDSSSRTRSHFVGQIILCLTIFKFHTRQLHNIMF